MQWIKNQYNQVKDFIVRNEIHKFWQKFRNCLIVSFDHIFSLLFLIFTCFNYPKHSLIENIIDTIIAFFFYIIKAQDLILILKEVKKLGHMPSNMNFLPNINKKMFGSMFLISSLTYLLIFIFASPTAKNIDLRMDNSIVYLFYAFLFGIFPVSYWYDLWKEKNYIPQRLVFADKKTNLSLYITEQHLKEKQ